MRNKSRKFPAGVVEKLGHYVYALIEPKEKRIFYIGKGGGSKDNEKGNHRLFSHFDEADGPAATDLKREKRKLDKIREIWARKEDVDWVIIRHRIESEQIAFEIESALIDTLLHYNNGQLTNKVRGHDSLSKGMLTQEDILDMGAEPAKPDKAYQSIFIFPIHNALSNNVSPYEATRKSWHVTDKNRNLEGAIAVGIENGICRGAFNIDNWAKSGKGRWQFKGSEIADEGMVGASWEALISQSKGYWQHGNYLIVEYDISRGFRFKHGSSDKTTFY